MKVLSKFFLIIFFIVHKSYCEKLRIGLCIAATNNYIKFVKPLIESARKHFLKNQNVTFFVFTDILLDCESDIKLVYLKHRSWPLSTMQRFEAYYNAVDLLQELDYVFACDADMIFLQEIEDEILSDRVATNHPLFYNDFDLAKEEYEQNKISTAYIDPNVGKNYFAGGFYGGKSHEFIKLIKQCAQNIRKDLNKNFIAKWHDESHLNKYFIDNPPTLILSPSYCYPENYWKWLKQKPFNFKPILMALDKDYNLR